MRLVGRILLTIFPVTSPQTTTKITGNPNFCLYPTDTAVWLLSCVCLVDNSEMFIFAHVLAKRPPSQVVVKYITVFTWFYPWASWWARLIQSTSLHVIRSILSYFRTPVSFYICQVSDSLQITLISPSALICSHAPWFVQPNHARTFLCNVFPYLLSYFLQATLVSETKIAATDPSGRAV